MLPARPSLFKNKCLQASGTQEKIAVYILGHLLKYAPETKGESKMFHLRNEKKHPEPATFKTGRIKHVAGS